MDCQGNSAGGDVILASPHAGVQRSVGLALAVMFALMLATAGCAVAPPLVFESSVHQSGNPMDNPAGAVRRVAVLPVIDHAAQPQQAALLRNAISHHLRRRGLFEVIAADKLGLTTCLTPAMAQSAFAEQMLVEMASVLQVDAVVILHATELRPYEPLRAAMTLHVVDAREAFTLATVDGVWDADDLATNAAAHAYFSAKSVDWGIAPEVNIVTPFRFYDFIGYDVALRLEQSMFPERAASAASGRGADCGPETTTYNGQAGSSESFPDQATSVEGFADTSRGAVESQEGLPQRGIIRRPPSGPFPSTGLSSPAHVGPAAGSSRPFPSPLVSQEPTPAELEELPGPVRGQN